MITAIIYTVVAVFCYMTFVFIVAQIKKNNGLADIAWGGGFILVAVLNLALAQSVAVRQIVVTILVSIWGSRLILHIYLRNRGKAEDFRYAEMRRRWGRTAVIRSFTNVFMFQGLLLLLIAYPLIIVNVYVKPGFSVFELFGLLVWGTGFLFEVVSDYQLGRFIKYEKNENNPIMTKGLWRYSRHPNYFGEAFLWWGILIIIAPIHFGWLAVFGPAVITFLLLKVSGVPMLEKRYAHNKPYQEYAKKTSIFVPLPPKK